MKLIVESYWDFIQTAQVAQEPRSFTIYSANPRKLMNPSRKKELARIARACKSH